MPATTDLREKRRQAILEIISQESVARQSVLVEKLQADGFQATQSSVSRDLREMNITKNGQNYAAPQNTREVSQGLMDMPEGFVRQLDTAGANITVIKTAVGAAQRVAVFLDRSEWPEIVGTISGDDTIFIATRDAREQKALLVKLQSSLTI
ncbi:MAG: transcriptional regulator of arginine metabolism [Gammaproteobacteria bacterium]|jgi:transcriptional regulator of arginine metabolism|tara:strand:- start:24 stop:479 length:456 start_codon:yes stop_codon:yes gene_type:complete